MSRAGRSQNRWQCTQSRRHAPFFPTHVKDRRARVTCAERMSPITEDCDFFPAYRSRWSDRLSRLAGHVHYATVQRNHSAGDVITSPEHRSLSRSRCDRRARWPLSFLVFVNQRREHYEGPTDRCTRCVYRVHRFLEKDGAVLAGVIDSPASVIRSTSWYQASPRPLRSLRLIPFVPPL